MEAVTYPGTLDALSPIRDYVRSAAQEAGLGPSVTYELVLAVDEIATNVITHGYEEAGIEGDISISAELEPARLVIQLIDHGSPYDPGEHPELDPSSFEQDLSDRPIGGLGIMLAREGVDELQYESGDVRNTHRFVTRLTPASPNFPDPVATMTITDEHRKLETLLNISRSLGAEVQLDRLLTLMVAEVTDAMEAERSTLFLVDRANPEQLVSRVAEGVGSREIRVHIGNGIAGATAATRQTINIPDAYNDARFNPAFDKTSGFRTRSILSLPIIEQGGRLVGVVQVLNKKSGGVFTSQDEQFLMAICVHLGIAIERAAMVEAYLQTQIVTKSLELAREIQMGLIPKDFPALPEFPEIDIFATMIPALDVGGDLYDFFPLDRDRICFIIGDVSDKGIPAALFMAMTRTAFKMAALASPESIERILSRVNQFLCESNPQQMFVTALAGILDLRTGHIDYADAGHEPPFILRPDGSVVKVDKVGGIVLGFMPSHEYSSGTMQLEAGDTLVLYTDGVTEAMNPKHQLFGADAIETALLGTGPEPDSQRVVNKLLEDMHAFVSGAQQSDDITALMIRFAGRAGAVATAAAKAFQG